MGVEQRPFIELFTGGSTPGMVVVQQGLVGLSLVPTEDLPCHLDSVLSGRLCCRRGRGFPQGYAKRPATDNVPVRDSGITLDLNELVAGLLSQSDGFNGRIHVLGNIRG